MKPHRSYFDPTYIQWRAKFAPFESRCFEALCEFVRAHFNDLLDRFCREGHELMHDDFPAWAFERYLEETERTGASEDVR